MLMSSASVHTTAWAECYVLNDLDADYCITAYVVMSAKHYENGSIPLIWD